MPIILVVDDSEVDRTLIAGLLGADFDWLIGEDISNPPETVVPDLEGDWFYRGLTMATVPLHFVTLLVSAWWVGTQDLSWWAFLGIAVAAGSASGLAINTAHELGHKNTQLEKNLAFTKFLVMIRAQWLTRASMDVVRCTVLPLQDS